MKRLFLFILFFNFLAGSMVQAQSQTKAVPSPSKTTVASSASTVLSTPSAQQTAVDLGPMPFSNEEANFYRKAWPIDKNHSLGALILFGTVVVLLLAGLIYQMAKSGPRKPPVE